jgi:hypothetical protein
MVEAGDLIYDTDNDRTYLVEAKDEPSMWAFLDLKENERMVFTESFINECFDIGFWRFAKTS